MRGIRLLFPLALVLTIAACPADRPIDDPTIDPPTVPPPAEEPAPAPAAATAQLQDVANTGITGELTATPVQNEVELTVRIANAMPNETLGARVQSGTCESPGPELARVDAVSTDAAGTGMSQTRVGHAPHLIMDGNHIVAVYAPGADAEVDTPIACAVIPAHQ